jgi:hypothetical protein
MTWTNVAKTSNSDCLKANLSKNNVILMANAVAPSINIPTVTAFAKLAGESIIIAGIDKQIKEDINIINEWILYPVLAQNIMKKYADKTNIVVMAA